MICDKCGNKLNLNYRHFHLLNEAAMNYFLTCYNSWHHFSEINVGEIYCIGDKYSIVKLKNNFYEFWAYENYNWKMVHHMQFSSYLETKKFNSKEKFEKILKTILLLK